MENRDSQKLFVITSLCVFCEQIVVISGIRISQKQARHGPNHIPHDDVNKVTDRVFDNLTAGKGGKNPITKKPLTYDRLHEAMTAVFRQINETIPGAKCIAPSKAFLGKILKESDSDKSEEINREEFGNIVLEYSRGRLVATCAKEVVLASLAVLAAAILTKEASRRIPKVGNLFAKVPTSIFFTTVALAVVFIVNKYFRKTPPSRIQQNYQ